MKNILILGGGFGGIRAALDLEKKLRHDKNWQVTLIDKNPNHTFTPNLYEVASAYGIKKDPYQVKLRGSICVPLEKIFKNKRVNLIQAEVIKVDIENQKVVTGGGRVMGFNYLVIALGAEVNDYGILGVTDYAFQMKNVDDGIAINEKLNELLKEGKEGKRNLPVQIIIGGGGFTGVETAAELACCSKNIARTCGLTNKCVLIKLIEAGPTILPVIPEADRKKVKNRLVRLGIKIIEGKGIKEIKNDAVAVDGENLYSDMTIWTGGIKPNRILASLKDSIALDEKRGLVLTDQFLKVKNLTNQVNIFAIGDNALILDPKTQKPVPAMAYTAVDQGKAVAENISRLINGKELTEYKPWYEAWIAPVGGKYALAHLGIGSLTVAGFLGWAIRQVVDFRYFLTILPFFKAIRLFFKDLIMFSKND